MMKKFAAIVLSALMALSMVSFAGAEGVLVMGTNPEFAPFEYVEGEEVVGVDVEIANEIAKDLGKELQIESMAFAAVIPSLATGKIDVALAAISITDERKLTVDFSDVYYNAKQACIVKKDGKIKVAEDLATAIIGVQEGTTGDFAASDISPNVERYGKALDAAMELAGGKIDALVVDAPVAKNIFDALNDDSLMFFEYEFPDEFYGIAVAKGQPELLASINATIARITTDGTLDAILEKYFPSK